MIRDLGPFKYTEEYYNKLKEVQAYLNGMSDIAKDSYEVLVIDELIALYENLVVSETLIKSIVATYKVSGISGLSATDVISCYDAYLYFQANGLGLTEEEFELYEQIYNEVAIAELAPFDELVQQLVVLTETDEILADLDSYYNDLNALVKYYVELSTSYKNAFELFYPESYEKLMLAIDSYNAFASNYINTYIYEYLGTSYNTLQEAQAAYQAFNFTMMKNYLLYSYEYIANWSVLERYIYNAFISELDKKIGSALDLGVVSSLIVTIPELNNEYNQYIDEFKAMFKYDITALTSKYDAALAKYKEDVTGLNLTSVHSISTTEARGSNSILSGKKTYYLYDSYILVDNNEAIISKALELYSIGLQAGIDIASVINDATVYTVFDMTYHFYTFRGSIC